MLPPGESDPHATEVIGIVQPASEYTPMFGVAEIVPDMDKFWLTVIAAKVEAVSAKAANVRRITIVFEAFVIATVLAPLFSKSCRKT